MIDVAAADDRHGLEAAMGMLGKAGHYLTVVHTPAIFAGEVLAQIASGQRGRRSQLVIAGGIGIDVMHTEQEGIDGWPGKAQGMALQDEPVFGGHPAIMPLAALAPPPLPACPSASPFGGSTRQTRLTKKGALPST